MHWCREVGAQRVNYAAILLSVQGKKTVRHVAVSGLVDDQVWHSDHNVSGAVWGVVFLRRSGKEVICGWYLRELLLRTAAQSKSRSQGVKYMETHNKDLRKFTNCGREDQTFFHGLVGSL